MLPGKLKDHLSNSMLMRKALREASARLDRIEISSANLSLQAVWHGHIIRDFASITEKKKKS
jgi:hypothetical protein